METGVWRGGASILMTAIIQAHHRGPLNPNPKPFKPFIDWGNSYKL